MWNGQEEEKRAHPDMSKITQEDYDKAKQNISDLTSWRGRSESRIMELLDEILREKQTINDYNNCIEYNREVVMMWEVKSSITKKKK